jgi:hypothetical protein
MQSKYERVDVVSASFFFFFIATGSINVLKTG